MDSARDVIVVIMRGHDAFVTAATTERIINGEPKGRDTWALVTV